MVCMGILLSFFFFQWDMYCIPNHGKPMIMNKVPVCLDGPFFVSVRKHKIVGKKLLQKEIKTTTAYFSTENYFITTQPLFKYFTSYEKS